MLVPVSALQQQMGGSHSVFQKSGGQESEGFLRVLLIDFQFCNYFRKK